MGLPKCHQAFICFFIFIFQIHFVNLKSKCFPQFLSSPHPFYPRQGILSRTYGITQIRSLKDYYFRIANLCNEFVQSLTMLIGVKPHFKQPSNLTFSRLYNKQSLQYAGNTWRNIPFILNIVLRLLYIIINKWIKKTVSWIESRRKKV